MPASLYRLVNKPHHTEIVVAPNQAPEEVMVTQVEETVAAVVESDVQIQDVQDPQPDVAIDTAEPDSRSWDPSWTKTKLLEFALGIGLDVSSTNTKTEIISALTTATQN